METPSEAELKKQLDNLRKRLDTIMSDFINISRIIKCGHFTDELKSIICVHIDI